MQPLIEKLEEIFGDFKESGVSLIDQEVADIETVGAENDDNEGKLYLGFTGLTSYSKN